MTAERITIPWQGVAAYQGGGSARDGIVCWLTVNYPDRMPVSGSLDFDISTGDWSVELEPATSNAEA